MPMATFRLLSRRDMLNPNDSPVSVIICPFIRSSQVHRCTSEAPRCFSVSGCRAQTVSRLFSIPEPHSQLLVSAITVTAVCLAAVTTCCTGPCHLDPLTGHDQHMSSRHRAIFAAATAVHEDACAHISMRFRCLSFNIRLASLSACLVVRGTVLSQQDAECIRACSRTTRTVSHDSFACPIPSISSAQVAECLAMVRGYQNAQAPADDWGTDTGTSCSTAERDTASWSLEEALTRASVPDVRPTWNRRRPRSLGGRGPSTVRAGELGTNKLGASQPSGDGYWSRPKSFMEAPQGPSTPVPHMATGAHPRLPRHSQGC